MIFNLFVFHTKIFHVIFCCVQFPCHNSCFGSNFCFLFALSSRVYPCPKMKSLVGVLVISLVLVTGTKSVPCSSAWYITELSQWSSFCSQGCVSVGSLSLLSVDGLTDLSGCETLQTISGTFQVDSNPNLESFTGFEQLQEIGENLILHNNPVLIFFFYLWSLSLVSLSGLSLWSLSVFVSLISFSLLSLSFSLTYLISLFDLIRP